MKTYALSPSCPAPAGESARTPADFGDRRSSSAAQRQLIDLAHARTAALYQERMATGPAVPNRQHLGATRATLMTTSADIAQKTPQAMSDAQASSVGSAYAVPQPTASGAMQLARTRHGIQQSGLSRIAANRPQSPVRQYKIGFEFQTFGTTTKFLTKDVPVSNKKGDPAPPVANEGKKPYYEGKGFSIEGDEGDLELVTKPFEETESGFKEMASTFSWMEVFAANVIGKRFAISQLPKYFASVTPQGDVLSKHNIFLNVGPTMLTDPQVTAGIQLGSLLTLAESLSEAPLAEASKESDSPGRGMTQPVLGQNATVDNLIKGIGWKKLDSEAFQAPLKGAHVLASRIGEGKSPKTIDYLFMLSLYCLGYSALWNSRRAKAIKERGVDETLRIVTGQGAEPFWAKLSVGMISRTNLADAFQALPEDDRVWFVENKSDIAAKLGSASSAQRDKTPSGVPGFDEPDLRTGRGPGSYRVFGPMVQNEDAENYRSWFSIEDWLSHLAPAADRLGVDFAAAYDSMGDISSRNFSLEHNVNDPAFHSAEEFKRNKEKSRGRYPVRDTPTNIGKATDLGEDRVGETGGLILEFRKLGNKIDQTQWWAFASNFFKLVVMTNQNKKRRDQIIDSFIGRN